MLSCQKSLTSKLSILISFNIFVKTMKFSLKKWHFSFFMKPQELTKVME